MIDCIIASSLSGRSTVEFTSTIPFFASLFIIGSVTGRVIGRAVVHGVCI